MKKFIDRLWMKFVATTDEKVSVFETRIKAAEHKMIESKNRDPNYCCICDCFCASHPCKHTK